MLTHQLSNSKNQIPNSKKGKMMRASGRINYLDASPPLFKLQKSNFKFQISKKERRENREIKP
jgi:hypothetical protein